MSSIIYVTEPEAIDLEVVKQSLNGTGMKFVSGDVLFSNSEGQDYDTLLIRSATKVGSTITEHFPHLKHIIRAGVGLDNVDLGYCKEADITVYNAPGANADAVSEYVVAVMLYALRKLNKLSKERIETWDRFAFRGSSIREQTIGIVGFGNIGRLLYEKLNVFSAPQFLVHDPYVSAESIEQKNISLVSLDELLEKSTVVSLHLPLVPETAHIINANKLSLLSDGTILINAARGGIVDEAALLRCVEDKALTYIADVVESEPRVSKALLENERIIVTPHIASLTSFSEKEMVRQALDNFLKSVPAQVF